MVFMEFAVLDVYVYGGILIEYIFCKVKLLIVSVIHAMKLIFIVSRIITRRESMS